MIVVKAMQNQTKTRILQAVRWALDQGYRVSGGEWGVYQQVDGSWAPKTDACLCPLGALLLQEQPAEGDPEIAAAAVLGVSTRWVFDFTLGVDGEPHHDSDAYSLGCEILNVL